MEPAPARPRHEAIDYDDLPVHEWRVTRLTRLGIPWPLAPAAAGHVDWHQVRHAPCSVGLPRELAMCLDDVAPCNRASDHHEVVPCMFRIMRN